MAGTPLASTPAAAPTPTQSHSQPPRTSTPVPVPRGVKREFDDSSVAQPNTQGPGTAAVNGSGGVTPTSVQALRPGAAKAGVPGARPRPLKKQRIVSHAFTFTPNRESPRERIVPISLFAHMIVRLLSLAIVMLPSLQLACSDIVSLTPLSPGPSGHARPSEGYASTSANAAAYSAGRITSPSEALFFPFPSN